MCLFRKNKSGYSLKGFWGETRHFNKNGEQTGFTKGRNPAAAPKTMFRILTYTYF